MSNNITACPLDCYDACVVIYDKGKLKALKDGHTQGFLCPHLNHYDKYEIITTPRYKGEEITLDEALEKLKELLSRSEKKEILHYRGSGNFGLMQEITDHFFASYGATLTDGTLCDGAGEAGIIQGRGSNKNMPLSEIEKSDVVIIWGRNPHTSSSHLLPIIKDKRVIVVDPIKTKIANNSDLHLQLKPHTDLYLAMILIKLLYRDYGYAKRYPYKGAREFYRLIDTIDIEALMRDIGVKLRDLKFFLDLTVKKKLAIVCGVGVQKYSDGADIMRAIDAFAVSMGVFGKEGCGVSYLGNSKEGIVSPFNTEATRVSKVNTVFDEFKTVFIQGANPLSQMPDSLRVKRSILKIDNLIYFGLYENETSQRADLVIPAKSFLYKNDIRTSYSHNFMMNMPLVDNTNKGISEYDLSAYLCKEFNLEIEREDFYLKHFKNFSTKTRDGFRKVIQRETIPYKNNFDTKDGAFIFLKKYEPYKPAEKGFYLITPKSAKSLNSQFHREKNVYLHSSLGYSEESRVIISSSHGSVALHVRHNDNIREDCVLIYSGTKGVNNLTSSEHSIGAKSAIFQENRVSIRLA